MSTQNKETGNSETKDEKSQRIWAIIAKVALYVFCILMARFAYFIYESLDTSPLEVSDYKKLVDYQKYYNFISVGIIAIYGFAASFIDFKSKGTGWLHFLASMKIHIGLSTLFLGLFIQYLSFDMSGKLSDYQRGKLTDSIVNTITDTVKSKAKDISKEVRGVDSTNTENTSKVVTYIDSMTLSANKRDSTISEMVNQVLTKSLDSINQTIMTHEKTVENTNSALQLLKSSIESTNTKTAETNRKLQDNAQKTTENLKTITVQLQEVNKAIKKILQTEEDSTNVADSVSTELATLGTSIDRLNGEFGKMDSSLNKAVLDIQEQRDIMLAVRVFFGTEKTLQDQGYLSTPQFMLLFWQNYKIKNFPDIKNSEVKTVYIGEPFSVPGELVALCNYDGRLREGRDYTVSTGESGETRVVLSRSKIAGQHILAVIKNKNDS